MWHEVLSGALNDSWFLFICLYFSISTYSSNLAPIGFSPSCQSSFMVPIDLGFSLLRRSWYMNSIKSSVDMCLFMATKRMARLTGDDGVCIEELFKARDLELGCGTRVGLDGEDDAAEVLLVLRCSHDKHVVHAFNHESTTTKTKTHRDERNEGADEDLQLCCCVGRGERPCYRTIGISFTLLFRIKILPT